MEINEQIEVVQYWNNRDELYEFMLASEWEKKMKGLEYCVIDRSNKIPFVILDIELKKADWIAEKKHIPKKSIEKFLTGECTCKNIEFSNVHFKDCPTVSKKYTKETCPYCHTYIPWTKHDEEVFQWHLNGHKALILIRPGDHA
jgi:hypothetical protein